MPSHDNIEFHNDQSIPPAAKETGKQDPEETVQVANLRSFGRPIHNCQLLTKRKVFQSKIEHLLKSKKHTQDQLN